MKKNLFILCFIFSLPFLYANNRTLSEAHAIALQFNARDNNTLVKQSPQSISLSKQVNRIDNEPAFYIFNKLNGFIIVSGDDQLPDILAYSNTENFDWKKAPQAFKSFMNQYVYDTTSVKTTTAHHIIKLKSSSQVVAPLLGNTKWNQNSPYNDQCPYIIDSDPSSGRCAVGCVATAISQIMYYHQYPLQGTGVSKTYTTRNGKHTCSSGFDNPYNWTDILPSYSGGETTAQKNAIARLCYDVGVAMEMNFDVSSGAYNSDAVNALPTYFGYDSDIFHYQRANYSYDEWENLIKEELDLQRPVLYGGQSLNGGHAFVCDGYNGDYFHINWGWGGMADGYFYLYALVPSNQGIGGGSADGYNYSQSATMGIHPPDAISEERLGMLSYSASSLSSYNFTQNETIDIDLEYVKNSGFAEFSGTFSANLYNQQDTSFYAEIKESYDITNLLMGYYYPTYTLSDCSFAAIPDGIYLLGYSYEAIGKPRISMKNITIKDYEYHKVTIQNGQVSIMHNPSLIDLTVNQLRLIKPTSVLYTDNIGICGFNIQNNALCDFEGQYIVQLSNSNHTYNVAQYRLFLRPTYIQDLEIELNLDNIEVGDYSLNIMIDTLHRSKKIDVSNSGWGGFDSFASIPVTVNAAPIGDMNLSVNAPLYFEGGDIDLSDTDIDIAAQQALLKVPILNAGVFGTKRITAYVFPASGGYSVESRSRSVILDTNESELVIFDFSHANLNDDENYQIGIYYDGSLDGSNNAHLNFTWQTEPLYSNYSLSNVISFEDTPSSATQNNILSVSLENSGKDTPIELIGVIYDMQNVELKRYSQNIHLNTNATNIYSIDISNFTAQSGNYQFKVYYIESGVEKYFDPNKASITFNWYADGVFVDNVKNSLFYMEKNIIYNSSQVEFQLYDLLGHKILQSSQSITPLCFLKKGIYILKSRNKTIKFVK